MVDVIKGEKVNISIRQAVAESIHQFVYSRFFPTSAALGYRKTEGCCQPHPSCLTMTKTQKNAKTNTKQIEMRKTNTALGYRKTEGCCQPHPSCLTMTKTQKNAKTNTKQIEMRKTNTALGYRKTEGCCQLHPSCLTMTKT